MLDMTTQDVQRNYAAIQRAIALYALFENMPQAEVQVAASASVTSWTQMGRLSYREVCVSLKWLGERRFIIWDRPQQTMTKMEVAA